MYSFHASTLKLSYHPSIEYFGSKKSLPLFIVLNTLESHGNDKRKQRVGFQLLYQAFCHTSNIQVENGDDERLCHAFVDNFNAIHAPQEAQDPRYEALFYALLKAALALASRIKGGHIVLDPPRA